MTKAQKKWVEEDWNEVSPVEFDPPYGDETFDEAVSRNLKLMEMIVSDLTICTGRAPLSATA